MPSRKQRRRRAKTFRHEYDYVLVDEDGTEREVDPAELRAEKGRDKPERPAAKQGRSGGGRASGSTRSVRTVQPPSWRRVGRRALIFAPLMFIAISLLDHRLSAAQHAAQTLLLLAFFLPFSYVMDSVAHRMYLRRTGQAPPGRGQAKG
jgi:hypothetical protein